MAFDDDRSSPEDTIEVAVRSKRDVRLPPLLQRLALTSTRDPDDAENHDVGGKEVEVQEELEAQESDEVEEYDFSNEPEDDEESDDGRDTAYYKNSNGAVIVNDSDEEEEREEAHWRLPKRPWRVPGFRLVQREWEERYTDIPQFPMHGDWNFTERYLAERDNEFFNYLEDIPIEEWVIPRRLAENAVSDANTRKKLRAMGLRIYSHPPHPFQPYSSTKGLAMTSPGPAGHQAHPMHQLPPQHQQGYMPRQTNGMQVPYGLVPQHGPPPPPQQAVGMYQHVPGQMGPPPLPNRAYQNLGTHAQGYGQVASSANGYASSNGKGPLASQKSNSIPIPPYPPRKRPSHGASSSKNRHDVGASDVYPWNRQMDWPTAQAQSHWNDGIYDPALLHEMDLLRQKNRALISCHEKGKKGKTDDQEDGSPQADDHNSDPRPPVGGVKGSAMTDYYSFATEADRQKALQDLKCRTPEEVMDKYFRKLVSLDICAGIKICWNPHKKGLTQHLTQVRFSVKDSVMTKEQIEHMPILSRTAALRMIDFAPNMLWKAMLLRTTSEGGVLNSEIRERMCDNGNYLDKATITKRIGTALGQKQQQSVTRITKRKLEAMKSGKIDGYGPGEEDFMHENTHDYDNYMIYFGRKITHREAKFVREAKAKKRRARANANANASSSDVEEPLKSSEPPKKRSKLDTADAASAELTPDSDETIEIADEGEEEDYEMVDADDAVSVQSDTMLDEIED